MNLMYTEKDCARAQNSRCVSEMSILKKAFSLRPKGNRYTLGLFSLYLFV
jgi:hypothetical protein